ncbi:uncharacterized protein TRAVEDRAFT_53075 [Trametes versicolor FP-101664 SS1]|uniref:uncharacterized protein n=1 Tax=Trametes versicolor (strain FP-101664) TaxID=717944 RepID=UPI0004622D5C|nr:uncharacterized protein TRAVEDRAFT_53075 [Trametes versicolor FP-101664 SS1]EIW52634.1 hypothetical protein TRAVEDRAFT_53075 [Trametes versicolor FP-101664 SS1]
MALCDAFLPHGTYALLNARGGTALDLACLERLEGHLVHYRANQQWKFVSTGLGWAIESCCKSKKGESLYLSIAGGRLAEQTRGKASTIPTSWDVALIGDVLRISWPKTNYVVELSGWGNSHPGTPIQIMRLKQGEQCQLWHFTRCGILAASSDHAEDVNRTGPRPTGPPPPTLHVLTNVDEDAALELENASRRWVKHGPTHKEPSQQWKFVRIGDEEVIQACRASLNNEPLYLTVQGRAEPSAHIVASPYPVGWHVERSQIADGRGTVRIFWPNTNLVISTKKFVDGNSVVLTECDDTLSSKWTDITI